MTDQMVLRAAGVAKHYKVRTKAIGRAEVLVAVAGADLELRRGETLGIVGESGCGKSTLAQLLVGDERPTEGHIELLGEPLDGMRGKRLRKARRQIQMVHQDPYKSLDPRMTIEQIIREPLNIHWREHPREGRHDRVIELLNLVGLSEHQVDRRPRELSGGQRQRVDIARALALDPEILVCDEAVSALDVSVQAQVINLLQGLKDELGLAMVFISHDLSVVQHVADRVAVMYMGRLIERGVSEVIYERAAHPYTAALLDAAPSADRSTRHEERTIVLSGEPPSPLDPPSGCAFRPRCWLAEDDCAEKRPVLREVGPQSQLVACHHPLTEQDQALRPA